MDQEQTGKGWKNKPASKRSVAFSTPEIWSIPPVLSLFPEVQHGNKGRENGLGAREAAERLRR